jgi:hypothetical protein
MSTNGRELVKAGFAASSVEADQIVNFLKENQITAYAKGGVMGIYEGLSSSGYQILVGEEELKRAKELLDGYAPIRTSSSGSGTAIPKPNRILNRIILTLIIVVIALPLILILIKTMA